MDNEKQVVNSYVCKFTETPFHSVRADMAEQRTPATFESQTRQVCYIKIRVLVGKTWDLGTYRSILLKLLALWALLNLQSLQRDSLFPSKS